MFLTDLGTETPEAQGFQIYASEGTIHIRNQSGNAYDVQVWSTGGQNMARSASVTRELLDIPMRHAASGIYMVCIQQGDKLLVKKVLLR